MRLFPQLTEEFTTPLTPTEIVRQLESSFPPPFAWKDMFKKNSASFDGEATIHFFSIQRIITYRNSWLPLISGKIHPRDQGSLLVLQHRVRWSVLVFSAIWLFGVGIFILNTLIKSFAKQALDPSFWMLLTMFIVGIILFTVPFWLDVRKSRPMLIKLLKLQAVAER